MNQAFNPEALTDLYSLQDEDSPNFVKTLVDDYVALSLRLVEAIEAARNHDIARLELESHSLKSSSKVLGLEHLAAVCFEIESAAREKRVADEAINSLRDLRTTALAALLAYTAVPR